MDSISVKSYIDLLKQLRKVDISVPPISKGRTKLHTERWTMFRFLSTFGESKGFEYPLIVKHRDKPDYTIEMPKYLVGAEITSAMPEDYARALVLQEKYFPNSSLDLSEFRWGMPKKSSKEIKECLKQWQTKLTGMGWVADEVESDWANTIADAVFNKTEKLNTKGFKKCDYNWLLIYDNVPQAALDIDTGVKLLFQYLKKRFNGSSIASQYFSTLFIETNSKFIAVENEKSSVYKIRNLWRKRGA